MSHLAAVSARPIRRASRILPALVAIAMACHSPSPAHAQCTEQGPFMNYTGSGQVGCPCFVAGEMAGAVFTLPASEYPIEITRVAFGWASTFGGAPNQIEESIHIYAGGLPDPGAPIFSLLGPQLVDGAINEFNLAPLPGEIRIESGPFTVALEFLNDNAGNPYAPSVYSDGNGCQGGRNVVFASPGGWLDACSLGVTGDWVIYVKYRSLKATAQGSPATVVFSGIPANETTCDTLTVANTGCDTLAIASISGCGAAPFSLDTSMTSFSIPPGGQTSLRVCATPTTAAPASCTVTVASNASNGPTVFEVSIDGVTAVGDDLPREAPMILGVAPNPFNPLTTVRFDIPVGGRVRLDIHDVAGRFVRCLVDADLPQGSHTAAWDGRDSTGRALASGLYFARLSADGKIATVGMGLVR